MPTKNEYKNSKTLEANKHPRIGIIDVRVCFWKLLFIITGIATSASEWFSRMLSPTPAPLVRQEENIAHPITDYRKCNYSFDLEEKISHKCKGNIKRWRDNRGVLIGEADE